MDDVEGALGGLAALGVSRIAVAGDSAGGGLALATGTPDAAGAGRIVGIAAMSPWIDLTLSAESMTLRADVDSLLSQDALEMAARSDLGTPPASDPRLPNLDADLSGLPPKRIHTGDAEVLPDDTRRYAARAEAAGPSAPFSTSPGSMAAASLGATSPTSP